MSRGQNVAKTTAFKAEPMHFCIASVDAKALASLLSLLPRSTEARTASDTAGPGCRGRVCRRSRAWSDARVGQAQARSDYRQRSMLRARSNEASLEPGRMLTASMGRTTMTGLDPSRDANAISALGRRPCGIVSRAHEHVLQKREIAHAVRSSPLSTRR